MADKMYLVLGDNSTYAENGFVAVLNEDGNSQLEETNDMNNVHPALGFEHVIDLSDLLAAYDQVHGTTFLETFKVSA